MGLMWKFPSFFFFMPFLYILDLLQLYIRLIDVYNVGGGTAEYYL